MRDQRSLLASEEDEETSEANISNEKLSGLLNLRDADFGEYFFAANAGKDFQVEEFPIADESIESLYSPLIQRRRRRLYAMMQGKGPDEICIKPIKKIGRGKSVFFASSLDSIFNRKDMRDFRGSKYRGISKNGSSW